MSQAKYKRAKSAFESGSIHSQIIASGMKLKKEEKHEKQMSNKKIAKKQRCISVKDPSKVTSFQASKVASLRKPKPKPKKKTLIMMSQHETPVLGKYFTAHNSEATLGKKEDCEQKDAGKIKPNVEKTQHMGKGSQLSQQDSFIKAPISLNQTKNPLEIVPPTQLSQNLDSTIEKLKTKQHTIEMLSKTIHTRLVDSRQEQGKFRINHSREDTYEVEMNFYIDKITELQKKLYEKERGMTSISLKQEEMAIISRNNRRLIKENTRLKESLELSEREVAALKKLLIKQRSKVH